MNKNKKLFYITLLSVFIFFFTYESTIAIDNGCSATTPYCVGSTTVTGYVCNGIVDGNCGGYSNTSITKSCDSNCSFNTTFVCTSNDLPITCVPYQDPGTNEWKCKPNGCSRAGNCCSATDTGGGGGGPYISCLGSKPVITGVVPRGTDPAVVKVNWTVATTDGKNFRLYVKKGTTNCVISKEDNDGNGCFYHKDKISIGARSYPVGYRLSPDITYTVWVANNPGTFIRNGETRQCDLKVSNPVTYSFSLTPTTSDAWWQVKDSDVITNGSVKSSVPGTSLYFNLKGDGGFPGLVSFSSSNEGSTNLTKSNVSEKGWLSDSSISNLKKYGSGYYIRRVPETYNSIEEGTTISSSSMLTSGGDADDEGYYWYVYDAENTGLPLNIDSNIDLGERKVILIVKGADVNINSNINLTKGSGFFLLVTTDNINVNPSIGGGTSPNLEGIFVSDGAFSSGTGGVASDTQLWLRGTVASYGGIDLLRDLGGVTNTTNPAELFEYAPDLELLFPISLSKNAHIWREVAP